jgi:hypothetical protein
MRFDSKRIYSIIALLLLTPALVFSAPDLPVPESTPPPPPGTPIGESLFILMICAVIFSYYKYKSNIKKASN